MISPAAILFTTSVDRAYLNLANRLTRHYAGDAYLDTSWARDIKRNIKRNIISLSLNS